jgi:hypothetical protein
LQASRSLGKAVPVLFFVLCCSFAPGTAASMARDFQSIFNGEAGPK